MHVLLALIRPPYQEITHWQNALRQASEADSWVTRTAGDQAPLPFSLLPRSLLFLLGIEHHIRLISLHFCHCPGIPV